MVEDSDNNKIKLNVGVDEKQFTDRNEKIEPWTAPEKRFCNICNVLMPYRARHCHECGKCVRKFDHHCFWIGGCVGELNHGKFWLFLFF